MPLILAIEPDKRQGTQLAHLAKGLHAELVQRTTAADGLAALHGRVPDLVLTSSLISPRDDSALAARLRELGVAAAHVQTVTIPLLGTSAPAPAKGGMLAALRREKPQVMTDGCAPDVFADQIRQYLATADEQRLAAATRVAPEFEATSDVDTYESAPIDDAVLAEVLPVEAAPLAELEVAPEPEERPTPFAEFTAPEPQTVVETPVLAEAFEPAVMIPNEVMPVEMMPVEADPVEIMAVETAAEPDDFLLDEPAGLPLSQLLQWVSETAVVEAPLVTVAPPLAAAIEIEAIETIAPIAEAAPFVEPEPVANAGETAEMYVDPMAAQALEELSQEAALPSLAETMAAEALVPVVEMHSFQSLDSIASELAAGPAKAPRYESLDDLASLFAATPAPGHARGETSEFASLFAEPAAPDTPEPIEVPGIDPSLFASAPASPAVEVAPEPILAAAPALALEPEPEPAPVMVPEPVMAAASFAPEPVEVEAEALTAFEHLEFEPVVFEPAIDDSFLAAAPALDEEIALDVDSFDEALAEPEPEEAEPIAVAAPAAAAPAPSPFSFTLVEGFGDEWTDFDVHGDGEPAPAAAQAAAPAPIAARADGQGPATTPALDAEALSLIGDAARKVSLDALVIEEFERGFPGRRVKKAKKKVHAGATQVTPAPEHAAKTAKRPVQDEWGMFDPEQCGFAALEDEEGADTRKPTSGTRVRVISY